MGNARGVRRDFVALEKRRFKAVKLFEKGLNNSEIGRRLKASNQTVSRWRREYQENGKVALRRAGRAGREPCLDEVDKASLVELLLQGPERLGLRNSLVDVSTGCALDQRELRGELSPRTRLAHPTAVELDCATTRGPRPGAQRRFDCRMEAQALAGD